MTVVSNTSPIVNLAAIGYVHLLRDLFGPVTIPEAVYREIVVAGAGRPGAEEVEAADWIVTRPVRSSRLARAFEADVHTGEAEALALALDLEADWILLDERAARKLAASLGLRHTGLLGVLAKAKERSLIPALKPLMDALRREAGFWISQALYDHVLQRVQES